MDKVEHWAFGFVLTFFYIVWDQLIWLAPAFAFGKEIYDYKTKGTFDPNDILATLAGFGTGAVFMILAFITIN